MADLANPPTSTNGSKLFALTYQSGAANVNAVPRSVREATINAQTYGHMGVGTHKDTDTYAAGDAVVLGAALNGTDVVPLVCNASGHASINDGGNSLTVDGTVGVSGTVTVATHAVTQSGTWNVGLNAGTNNIGDVDILSIAAGTNTIGGVRDTGWDQAGAAVVRGLLQSQTIITETTIAGLEADASNLYNIKEVVLSIFSGSTAPAAFRRLKLRMGTAGTVFHTEYIPATANIAVQRTIHYDMPVRSTTNQPITAEVDGALGTSGEYSIIVQAYKTSS
jgi:hypothetical protein